MLGKLRCLAILATLAVSAALTAACRPGPADDPAPPRGPAAEIAALEEQLASASGPEVYVHHEKLAASLAEAGRPEDAKRHYRELLRLRPEDGAAWLALSRLEARTGAYDEAVATAAEGVRNVPGDAKLRSWYGETLMKRGRRTEAEEVLRQTLELDGAGAYPHYVLGLVYLGDGRLEEARRQLEAATALQASAHEAWYQLAVACERLGDLDARDRALEEFARLYRQRLGAGG